MSHNSERQRSHEIDQHIASNMGKIIDERDRLRAQVAALSEALQAAQELRPTLLRQYGAVPECVLDYCNSARAALAKLEEDA